MCVGQSQAMKEVLEMVDRVAPVPTTILIEGESGTGKELVARAIHELSGRNKAKFIPVHCAALSPQLLESELFGHEKGAFTDAIARRIGRFEQADGGTLFLDEIGEIDPTTQVKLLRVLGERTFERVGGDKTIEVDVRVIAATNRNLQKMVSDGKFRGDLYYRLNVIKITMPALRERMVDLQELANAFLQKWKRQHDKTVSCFGRDAYTVMLAYNWPGNVRELENAVERAVVLCVNDEIHAADLSAEVRGVPLERIRRIVLIDDEPENCARFVEGARRYEFKTLAISACALDPNTEVEIATINPSRIGRSPEEIRRFFGQAILIALDINFERAHEEWGWENGVDLAMFAIEHMAHLSRNIIWLTRTPNYEAFLNEARERIMQNPLLKDHVDDLESFLPGLDRIVQVPRSPMPAPDLDSNDSVQFWGRLRDKILQVLTEASSKHQTMNGRKNILVSPAAQSAQAQENQLSDGDQFEDQPPRLSQAGFPPDLVGEVVQLILNHLPAEQGMSKLSDLKNAFTRAGANLAELQRETMKKGPFKEAFRVSLRAKLEQKWKDGTLFIKRQKELSDVAEKVDGRRARNAIERVIRDHFHRLTWGNPTPRVERPDIRENANAN